MITEQGRWITEKPFGEVVELLPHLRALGIGVVWVGSGPRERVMSVSASRTTYNGIPAGVDLSVLVEGIDLRWSVDILNHCATGGADIDVDAVSTLLQELPPKPRAAFTAILNGWMENLDQQMGRLASDTAKLVRVKDGLTQLHARGDS